jgi:hypothetical protein
MPGVPVAVAVGAVNAAGVPVGACVAGAPSLAGNMTLMPTASMATIATTPTSALVRERGIEERPPGDEWPAPGHTERDAGPRTFVARG